MQPWLAPGQNVADRLYDDIIFLVPVDIWYIVYVSSPSPIFIFIFCLLFCTVIFITHRSFFMTGVFCSGVSPPNALVFSKPLPPPPSSLALALPLPLSLFFCFFVRLLGGRIGVALQVRGGRGGGEQAKNLHRVGVPWWIGAVRAVGALQGVPPACQHALERLAGDLINSYFFKQYSLPIIRSTRTREIGALICFFLHYCIVYLRNNRVREIGRWI